MPKRSYGQFEGLANALDLVGERWTLLLVRELLLGPRRYKDLLDGLPGIGTNLLASRLKDLEAAGLIDKRVLPAPAGSAVYELTERGRGLEPALTDLARWGMAAMEEPRPTDVLRPGWGVLAFKAVFHSEPALGIHETYEFDIDGDVFHLRVDDGMLHAAQGPARDPDVVFATDVETLLLIGAAQLSPAEAVGQGRARITGDPEVITRVEQIFGFAAPGPPDPGAVWKPGGEPGWEPGWGPAAMRATFRPEAAKGIYETYEMHVGSEVFHMIVADGTVQTASGPADDPDFVFTSDLATFMAIGAGQVTAMDAVVRGLAEVRGSVQAALRCPAIFGFGPAVP